MTANRLPQLVLIGGLFGVLILACLYRILRPVTLIANRSGFVLTGAFVRSSEVRRWSDIERFFVIATATGNRVACTLAPGALSHFGVANETAKAELIFAGLRPADPNQVVAELNALRQRVVGDAPAVVDDSPNGVAADQGSSGWKNVQPTTIQASPAFYAIGLAILLMPVVLMTWMEIKGGRFEFFAPATLAIILAPFMARYLWLALNPPVLSLDWMGFTYPGGFARSARTIAWKDIQNFAVYVPKSSRGYKMPRIAYFLRSDVQAKSGFLDILSWTPQKLVPWFYVNKVEQVVNQLNAYRQHALGLAR